MSGHTHSDSTESRKLLDRVRGGDRNGLGTLLSRHREYLRQVVSLRLDQKLRPRIDASDVVQETELEACQRINDYLSCPALPFRLWLRRIAQDRLADARRRHLVAARRSVERELPLPDRSSVLLASRVLGQGPSPSEQVAASELARMVRLAMSQLPELDREVLLMVNFEQLTSREIGHVLDMEAAAVRKRYGRALRRLKDALTELGAGDCLP